MVAPSVLKALQDRSGKNFKFRVPDSDQPGALAGLTDDAQQAAVAAIPNKGAYPPSGPVEQAPVSQWDMIRPSKEELIQYLQGSQTPEPAPLSVESWGLDLTALPPEARAGIRQTVTAPDGVETTHSGAALTAVNENYADVQSRFDNAAAGARQTKDPAKQEAQYDHIVDLIGRYGRESEDGDTTVIAPMFAALAGLDTELRQSLLRRAGNPPAFATLNGDGLADLPSINATTQAISQLPPSDPLNPRPPLRADERSRDAKLNQTQTPLENKLTSHTVLPDSLHPKALFAKFFEPVGLGVPQNGEEFSRFWDIAFAPENQDIIHAAVMQSKSEKLHKLYELIRPGNVSDSNEAMYNLTRNAGDTFGVQSSSRTQSVHRQGYHKQVRTANRDGASEKSNALRGLAGDQIRMLQKIKQRGNPDNDDATNEFLKSLDNESIATRDAFLNDPANSHLLSGPAQLPPLAGGALNNPQVLTIGTGATGNLWGGRGNVGRMKAADVVEWRNQDEATRLQNSLYKKTQPPYVPDSTNPSIPVELLGGDSKEIIDLDKLAPWWRARFGEPDSTGVSYPDKFLSAEFVTSALQHQLGNNDPDFVRRMLPLIERSIAAMPEQPVGKRALSFYGKVFLPSSGLVEKASSGTLSMRIHGLRNANRGPAEVPQRHGFQPQPFTRSTTRVPTPDEEMARRLEETDAAMEELRNRDNNKTRKPGKSDQSSIHKMNPSTSPLRSLLA